ncbi:hypothetical protein IRJ41_004710 [Triplophysa rosa]|uniref:Immunoglobulin subtype domain-containing protein n=1 Tax=Triplophysa rosa TaxID=992332 RepID=A0A9W7WE91_TRIRA|nr:hypothetical protein IRJ41_004710 [Triplophysa rosa]
MSRAEHKTMNDVRVVLLVALVCIFTVIHTGETDSFNLTCEDVTGHVGVELNLTCRVSDQRGTCCVKMYKLMNTADNDTTICKELKNNSCLHRMNFTCAYTANSNMTTQFKFFLQTTCGRKTAEFTVNITESSEDGNLHNERGALEGGSRGFPVISIIIVVIIIIIIIIIINTVMCKTAKCHCSKSH